VFSDVLSSNIGDEGAVPVALPIEDQAPFLFLAPLAKALRSEKDPQFERHVESRQIRRGIEVGATEVIDGEPAIRDKVKNPLHPDLPAILDFQSTTGLETAVEDGEDDRLEERLVALIERAVDENALVVPERDDHMRAGEGESASLSGLARTGERLSL
jgi:hypothetical protein